MNRSYRSIYNHVLGAWVAVSELTRARGKRVGGSSALAMVLVAMSASPAGAQSALYWDIDGAASAGAGGSAPAGSWSAGGGGWSTSALGESAGTAWVQGSNAIFAAGSDAIASYTVGLSGSVSIAGIRYEDGAAGSVLTLAGGDSLDLAGAVTSEVQVAAGSTLRVEAGIVGASGLRKTGAGTLSLVGASSYSGGTWVEAGVLEIASDGQLGVGSGSLNLADGGTLRLTASHMSSWREINLLGSGGVVDVNGTENGVFAGTVSGAGALALVNTGAYVDNEHLRITLSGNNDYSGGTRLGIEGVSGGRVNAEVTGSSSLGTGDVHIYLNSELMFRGAGASAGGLTITTHESSNRLGTNSGTYFIDGASAGSATLVNQGKGSYTIFDGAGTSAGSAQIQNNGGRVHFFGDTSGGSATIQNEAGGLVDVWAADLSGTTVQNNAGTVFISNSNSGVAIGSLGGAGNVVLGGRQLRLGGLGKDDTISGAISDAGVGYLDSQVEPQTYVAAASAVGGSLVKEGAGTLTLAGNNSYSGTTTVNGGILRIEGDQSLATGAFTVNAGGTLSSSASGLVGSAVDVQSGGTLAGNGTLSGAVDIASGGRLAPGNSPGTLTVGTLILSSGSQLDFELGQPGTPGGPLNDLVNVTGDLSLAGTLNVSAPVGGSFGPGLYRLMNYGGGLMNNGLAFGSVPGSAADLYLQTSVAQQINLVNRAGLSLNFWDGGSAGSINNNAVDGGAGVMRIGSTDDRWTDASGSMNAGWTPNGFAIFQGAAGTVAVSNSNGAVTFSGAQFAVDGYTITGDALTTDNANTVIRVGDGTAAGASYTATVNAAIGGSGALVKEDLGTLVLAGANSHSGGTRLSSGTLMANNDAALGSGVLTIQGGTLGSQSNARLANNIAIAGDFALAASTTLALSGDVALATLASTAHVTQTTAGAVDFGGAISGANGLTLDATAASGRYLFSGSKSNSYTGATTVQGNALLELSRGGGALAVPADLAVAGQGAVLLQASEQIANGATLTLTSTGQGGNDALQFAGAGMTETVGALMGSGTVGLAGSKLMVGAGDFRGQIRDNGTAGGGLEKIGSGTLRLSGPNSYSGPTTVSAGTLQAGAAQAFSANSAHSVAAGATLDTGGFTQSMAALTNSGTVSLLGSAPGSELVVRGSYVGNNGQLRLGTVLNAAGPSDRLVLDGPAASASGRTSVQISNAGGLGALTTGAGIEVIAARNGATTTAQSSRDAFVLAGGHVDAGAYEYLLLPADERGAGESWYLRSHSTTAAPPDVPVPPKPDADPSAGAQEQPRYRAEVPLFAALPAQLRQSDTAMLSNLHRRIGDDDVRVPGASGGSGAGGERRAWGRLIGADLDLRQEGTVSPASSGHLEGLQVGTDLFALPAANWRAGIYVGQMDSDARVSGLARDGWGRVGTADLRSQYLGAYATYATPSGFYADAVLQVARHKYTLSPDGNAPVDGKGDGLQASIEVGQSFGLGGGWFIEPQLQLVHEQVDLDDVDLAGTRVRNDADSGWLARAGVRIKGELSTGLGSLQPYARVNVYRASSGQDRVLFSTAAGSATISSAAGYTSAELAGGFTWSLSPTVSVYGELGRVFDISGDARVKSSIEGSGGLRVRW